MASTKKVKNKQSFDVSGWSIEDIAKIDISDLALMSTSNIKKITSRLVSAYNKRLARLERSELGRMSPTYQHAKKNKFVVEQTAEYTRIGETFERYSVKGLDAKSVVNLFQTLTQKLNLETSTLKGFKAYRKRLYNKLGVKFNDINTERKFWDIYHRYDETKDATNENFKSGGGSPVIMQYIANQMGDFSSMSAKEQQQVINKIYEDLKITEQKGRKTESSFMDDYDDGYEDDGGEW